MKLLLTGANGQLAHDIIKQFKSDSDFHIYAMSKKELDITNKEQVHEMMHQVKPDIVINAAAFTGVDLAETNSLQAYEVNSIGAYHLAKAAEEIGAIIVFISTDYIFNGKKGAPYIESDVPDPLSVYGNSKWLGERFVELVATKYYIVRTSWLFGLQGNNFVKTMLLLAQKGEPIHVVNDQVGSPTYTKDLAYAIKQLIGKPYGIYHISNEGSCSWYEFAQTIWEMAGYDPTLIKETSTEQYGATAARPAYSLLSKERLYKNGIGMRVWKEALQDFIDKVGEKND